MLFPHRLPSTFSGDYHCYSVAFVRADLENKGNKILLPQSALIQLANLNVSWPMIFEITNKVTCQKSHCGVLEFIADEGKCNMPYWMMKNLGIEEGSIVNIKNTTLPKGSFVKLQPLTSDFLEITNPRVVLETALRHFATLTKGDTISVSYGTKTFEIEILDLKPANAVSVIETDIQVDFAAPKDYKEPSRAPRVEKPVKASDAGSSPSSANGALFSGKGARIGKKVKSTPSESPSSNVQQPIVKTRLPMGVRTTNEHYEAMIRAGHVPGIGGGRTNEQNFSGVFQGAGRALNG